MSNDLDDLGPTHLWKPEIGVVSHGTLVTVTRYTSYDTWEFHLRQVGTGKQNIRFASVQSTIIQYRSNHFENGDFSDMFCSPEGFFLSLAYDFGQVSCPDQWCFSMGNEPGNDKLSQVWR